MKSEKFNKIPEIFNGNKKSLEKVLGTELTFHKTLLKKSRKINLLFFDYNFPINYFHWENIGPCCY